jgi:hypothetical protein
MSTKISNVKNDDLYRVVLLRPVRVGRTLLRPGADVTMKGWVIKEHADDIKSVSPATD